MIFTYTPKEREQLLAIEKEYIHALAALSITRAIMDKYGSDSQLFKDAKATDIKKLSAIDQRFKELIEELDNARFNKLKNSKDILKDAKKKTLDAIIYAYVRIDSSVLPSDREGEEKAIADLSNSGLFSSVSRWDFSKAFRKQKKAKFNPEKSPFLLDEIGLITFIKRSVLDKHIEALKGLPEAEQLENYVLQTVAASPYTINSATVEIKTKQINPDSTIFKPYMTMYNSKPTNQLARINYRDAEFDPINGEAKATSGELTVIFNDYQKLKNKIKNKSEVRVHQLLSTIVSSFTDQNDYSKKNKKATNYRVSIPLDDYLIACGHNIEEKETDTPEEAAKEKKRAAYARKDGRKKVADSLNILYNISLDWNGENEELHRKRILSEFDLERKQINVTLNPGYGDYLVQHPQTQYPKALLAVDARNPNAYSMGLFMANHYNKYNNQIIGTFNRLKVETLLKYTNLPDIAAVKKQRKSWPERIKEPFENSLDELTKGLLEDWEYTRAKGVKLTDAEAMQITDYPTFKNLYITFKLKDAPDNTERLARRAKEKEESQQRKKQFKKKS